jgi:hypothetical protein
VYRATISDTDPAGTTVDIQVPSALKKNKPRTLPEERSAPAYSNISGVDLKFKRMPGKEESDCRRRDNPAVIVRY